MVSSEVEPDSAHPMIRAAWIIPKHISCWSLIGILKNEMQMFQKGLEWYPGAEWIYLVSGDTLPTKPPGYFTTPPILGSILGSKLMRDFPGWSHGCQFIVISRADLVRVLRVWHQTIREFEAVHRHYMCPHGNPLDAPDVQYLHTILHRDLGESVCHRGVSITWSALHAGVSGGSSCTGPSCGRETARPWARFCVGPVGTSTPLLFARWV